MQTRVAVIGIIVERSESVSMLNAIVHEYRAYILGRMGIPYERRDISIVSLAIDAPLSVINALSGKLGRLEGVTVKTAYASLSSEEQDKPTQV